MFWRKNKEARSQVPVEGPRDSVDAMICEAFKQGWLPDKKLGYIPELVAIYKRAADYFIHIIDETDPRMHETLVCYVCRYLFAKGVEGVILWGMAPDRRVSVYFHPDHLVAEIETGVPSHLHETVIKSMPFGESLFSAHQAFVMACQKAEGAIDLPREINKTVKWIARFGIQYALFHSYQNLR